MNRAHAVALAVKADLLADDETNLQGRARPPPLMSEGPAVHVNYSVADLYAVNIVNTAQKVRNGNLAWAAGAKSIDEAQKSLRENWKAYSAAYIDENEKALAAKAERKMGQALSQQAADHRLPSDET
jgi:hypothetical protein